MNTKYTFSISNDTLNGKVSGKLDHEVIASPIEVAFAYTDTLGDVLDIWMKAPLTPDQQAVLASVVAAHKGEEELIPQPVIGSVTAVVQETPPFSQPTYRTKRSKTDSAVLIPPGSSKTIDFQLTQELYVSGGAVIVKNGCFKDYITASVYDKNSVIPAPYRAALCENWPTIATYVVGEWLECEGNGCTVHRLNTYPLNAKISAGLFLRVTFFADAGVFTFKGDWVAETSYSENDIVELGGVAYRCKAGNISQPPPNESYWELAVCREILINYNLTKKL